MGYDQRIKYVFTFELNIAKYVNYIVSRKYKRQPSI